MSQYQTIKTQAGLALESAAETGGSAIKLVAMSVGDGRGSGYIPSSTQTALKNEVARVNLNNLQQNSSDATQWVAEAIFPADIGGFTVREIGLWTDNNVLFAVANFPDTYKPDPFEGTAGQLLIKLNFRAQNSDNITIVVDGNLLLATQDWVNNQLASTIAKYVPLDGSRWMSGALTSAAGSFTDDTQAGGFIARFDSGNVSARFTVGLDHDNFPYASVAFFDQNNGFHQWVFEANNRVITPDGNTLLETILSEDGHLWARNFGKSDSLIAWLSDVQAETARAMSVEADCVKTSPDDADWQLNKIGVNKSTGKAWGFNSADGKFFYFVSPDDLLAAVSNLVSGQGYGGTDKNVTRLWMGGDGKQPVVRDQDNNTTFLATNDLLNKETTRAQQAESGLQPRGNYVTAADNNTKTVSFITKSKHGQRIDFPTTFGDDNVIVTGTVIDGLNNRVHLLNYFNIDKSGFSPSITVWNGSGLVTEDNLVEVRITATGKN